MPGGVDRPDQPPPDHPDPTAGETTSGELTALLARLPATHASSPYHQRVAAEISWHALEAPDDDPMTAATGPDDAPDDTPPDPVSAREARPDTPPEAEEPSTWLDRPDRPPPLPDTRPYDQYGGLSRPDPADQRALEDAMPKRADGSPARFPDPRDDWLPLVNDGGPSVDPFRGNNCLDCSLSTIATWHGEPTVAAPRHPEYHPDGSPDVDLGEANGMTRAEDWLQHRWEYFGPPRDAYREIEDRLQAGGHGASAEIVNTWTFGGAHAWNAVNRHGEVLWVDAQSGSVSAKPVYKPDRIVDIWAIVVDREGKPL